MSNSVTAAVSFLTRPLLRLHTPSAVISLQTILTSTLQAAILVPSSLESSILAPSSQLAFAPELILSLSPFTLPPRPIYAACVAVGVRWCDWMACLGGVEFELTILADRVTVHLGTAEMCIWQSEPEPEVQVEHRVLMLNQEYLQPKNREPEHQVPISKLAIHHHASYSCSHSLAQQLFESDHEEEETEEMFAMISKQVIVSPTPTRDHFMFSKATPGPLAPGFPYTSTYPYGSPISSPEPSSSSSAGGRSELDDYSNDFEYDTFSDFSYASDDDDDELSMTESQRFRFPKPTSSSPAFGLSPRITLPSAADMEAKTVIIPRLPNLAITPCASSNASSVTSFNSTTLSTVNLPPNDTDAEDSEIDPADIYIDTSKKAVTSYLYQGGKSTVLSGGVMLGAVGKPSSSSIAKPKQDVTRLTRPRLGAPSVTRKAPVPASYAAAAAAKPQTYKAPIGGRTRLAEIQNSKADSSSSWRRAAVAPTLRG